MKIADDPTDFIKIARNYISLILEEEELTKTLVLDQFTIQILSVTFFKSQLFKYKVFETLLLEDWDLDKVESEIQVLIIQPSKSNFKKLISVLQTRSLMKLKICKNLLKRFYQRNFQFSDRDSSFK